MTSTIRQHFVPQAHLRNFTDRDGKIWVYDKVTDKSFKSSVENVAVEKHFYNSNTIDSREAKVQYIEREFLGTFEQRVIGVIRRILAACADNEMHNITSEDRLSLEKLVALQWFRTPATRKAIREVRKGLEDSLDKLRAYRPSALIDRMLRTNDQSDGDNHNEALVNEALLTSISDRLKHLLMFVRKGESTHPLFTSDHPITRFDFDRTTIGLNWTSPQLEVAMPLSSSCVLSFIGMGVPGIPPHELNNSILQEPLTAYEVKHYNVRSIHGSIRFVYSSNDDFALVRQVCEADPSLRNPDRNRIAPEVWSVHLAPELLAQLLLPGKDLI